MISLFYRINYGNHRFNERQVDSPSRPALTSPSKTGTSASATPPATKRRSSRITLSKQRHGAGQRRLRNDPSPPTESDQSNNDPPSKKRARRGRRSPNDQSPSTDSDQSDDEPVPEKRARRGRRSHNNQPGGGCTVGDPIDLDGPAAATLVDSGEHSSSQDGNTCVISGTRNFSVRILLLYQF